MRFSTGSCQLGKVGLANSIIAHRAFFPKRTLFSFGSTLASRTSGIHSTDALNSAGTLVLVCDHAKSTCPNHRVIIDEIDQRFSCRMLSIAVVSSRAPLIRAPRIQASSFKLRVHQIGWGVSSCINKPPAKPLVCRQILIQLILDSVRREPCPDDRRFCDVPGCLVRRSCT